MLFFLKDNKKEFILWLNVPKVTAYKQILSLFACKNSALLPNAAVFMNAAFFT